MTGSYLSQWTLQCTGTKNGSWHSSRLLSARSAVTPAALCYLVNWDAMGVNSLPKTVTRQRRDCDLGTERRFSSKSQHMNIHTAKYRCTDCGKCCQSGSELAVHMRSHSGEKPFECRPTVCSKRFAQVALWITEEFTVERNRTNDTCVTRRLLGLDI